MQKTTPIDCKQVIQRKCHLCHITFVVCLAVSITLIVAGFILPPVGVIDGSVLTAVGELVLFPALAYGYKAIELGMDVKFEKGDASVTITNDAVNGNE